MLVFDMQVHFQNRPI